MQMTMVKSNPRVRRAVLPTRVLWQGGRIENLDYLLMND